MMRCALDIHLRNQLICVPIQSPFQSSQEIVEGTVLGRIGHDSDMAGVSLFLASKAGSYITGTVIVVDGGILVKPRL
jgi:NAD(P)-dependent dehydrogenase (short-subunit alcohol dehydrogenase family)